jgi:HlyD family secretion protein
MKTTHWITAAKKYAIAHKFISALAVLLVLGGGWWAYGRATAASAETRYVLGTVEKGTVVSSISASGQVSASNQVDIKPKVSGDIVWLGMKAGMNVTAWQALATIDDTNARQAVTNAELDLKDAQLTLQKNTSQAPIDFQNSKDAVTKAEQDIVDAYENMYSTVSDAYITLPGVMTEADGLLHDFDISSNSNNAGAYQNLFISSDDSIQRTVRTLANRAEDDYAAARAAYTKTYADFKALSRNSSSAQIGQALTDTQQTAKLVSQALSSEVNFIDTVVDISEQLNRAAGSSITVQQTSAHTQLTTINSLLSKLSSQVTSIQNAQQALKTAQQALTIVSIGNPDGATPFDLELQKNDVAKKEAALAAAKQALADHVVRAPFAGVLAAVNVQAYDTASTGSVVATLITNRRIAELSLNEVDAAKIKVGDKATLTFDAIDSLSLTGSVAEINTIGAVTQGVVSYTIKIAFDSQDERVKPGMTVNAAIITDAHQDVLIVPASAVKQQLGTSYVQVFDPPLVDTGGNQGNVSSVLPQQVEVVIGISDDTNTEITSGVTVGQQIVVRTISGTTVTAVSSAPSLFGAVGGNRTGTGAVRTTTGR